MAQPGAEMKMQPQLSPQPGFISQPHLNGQPPQPMRLAERVEILVACGESTKSDMFCVIYVKNSRKKDFELMGQTEELSGFQNPARWKKQFPMDYYFEEEQILKFDVYSATKKGGKTKKLKDHKLVGTTSCVLGEVFHETGSIMQKKLMYKNKQIKNKKTKRFMHLLIFAGKVRDVQDTRELKICFNAHDLIKADKMGLSDPYFLILRDGNVIYGDRKSHLKTTVNPKWAPFHINTQILSNNNPKTEITIELWDWDDKDKSGDDFLGKIITTQDQLKNAPKHLEIINDKRKNKKNKKNQFGTFSVMEYKSASTFIDYLQGGVEMSLMTALDFTASNGHPQNLDSLHCIQDPNTGQPVISQYQHAIRVIGNIVSIYDDDQMYPLWGFGVNVPSESNEVLHSFNLNYNKDNPEVHGIHGIEQTYINTVNAIQSNTVILSGPTFFTPILKKAGMIAGVAHKQYMTEKKNNPDSKPKYFILLMITDGVIDDMKQTKDTIVQISNAKLPLSIIIVGVGNEDFSKMVELDADDEPLVNSKGQAAYRDIVQFLPFNQIASSNDMALLAKETLCEIPAQFQSYVDAHSIEPLSRKKPKYKPGSYDTTVTDQDDDKLNEEQPKVIDYNIQSDPWLNAPLPPGWERAFNEDNGTPYYINHATEKTQWEHPAAVAFHAKIKEKQEKEKSSDVFAMANNAFGGDADWMAF